VKISLIVCTRNRAARLPEFFDRLAVLDFPHRDWELLLVDHASTDETADVIRRFAATTSLPVRPLYSSAPALCGAKNEALAQAEGDILAFTDDDCYPRADYLTALDLAFREYPVGIVGGRVVLHDPTDARVSIRDVEVPETIEPETFVQAGVIHGANLAIARDVIADIGGFDPLFGPGTPCVAAEDVEIIARAVWSGWRARFDPRPVVAHHHGRKPGPDTDSHRRGYDYGRGAYYMKYLLWSPKARGIYARQWRELTRRGARATARRRLARELAGGARYLRSRVLNPSAIPAFDGRKAAAAPAPEPSRT
jgi:glycosyltransferase involved in cell wall biosynthesis